MKKLIVAVAVLGWIGMASWCPAQQMARSPVVMVDLNHIFENYAGFTEMQADLKTQVTVADTKIKGQSTQLKQLHERLQQMQKGSAEYQKLEETITKQSNDVRLKLAQHRRTFAKQEAQIVFRVYKEVLAEISMYCRRSGARLALQFKSEDLKDEDYQQVFSRIQHPVLFAEPSIDITRVVLDQLNRRHASRGRGTRR